MANTILPILGTQGFVEDSSTKFDLTLSHFFLSDYNQSYLYSGNIYSLQRIFQQTGQDAEAVSLLLREHLTSYLNSYYDNVEITNVVKEAITPSGTMEIEMTIRIIDSDKTYGFTRVLKTENSTFSEIIKINNFG